MPQATRHERIGASSTDTVLPSAGQCDRSKPKDTHPDNIENNVGGGQAQPLLRRHRLPLHDVPQGAALTEGCHCWHHRAQGRVRWGWQQAHCWVEALGGGGFQGTGGLRGRAAYCALLTSWLRWSRWWACGRVAAQAVSTRSNKVSNVHRAHVSMRRFT
jgi:hypothetical protein